MARLSIVVLADTETSGDLVRIANALTTAHECLDAGDEFEVLFDGAGTKWIAELAGRDHKLSPTFDAVRDHIAGACDYCAKAFGVRTEVNPPVSHSWMSTSSTPACAGGSSSGSRSSRSDFGHWNQSSGHAVGCPHDARRVAG